jgi:plastocyanin domain-containing protein
MKTFLILALSVTMNFSQAEEKPQTYNLAVTEEGFIPSTLNVKPGAEVILNVTRKTNSTCATQIKVPSKNIKQELPLNKVVKINLGKLEKGEVKFSCGMDMVSGVLFVK